MNRETVLVANHFGQPNWERINFNSYLVYWLVGTTPGPHCGAVQRPDTHCGAGRGVLMLTWNPAPSSTNAPP
jgi:hypothetical protein